jgi:NDP-sugar pyrophosphorylase family protein
MKAGASILPEQSNNVSVDGEMEIEPNNIPGNTQNILSSLGFEEGELEMFFDVSDGVVNENELIQKYLEIAQDNPYNLNWGTVQVAVSANYDTGVRKPNGTTYTKHDIANDTLNSFYDVISHGGRSKKNKKRKTRKNKKRSKHNRKSRKNRKSRHRHRN